MLKLQISQGPLMTEQLSESGFHNHPIIYGIPHDDGSVAILGLCRFECRDGRIVLANPGVLIDDVDKDLVRLLKAVLKATVQESELSFFRAKNFISTDGREQRIIDTVRRAVIDELHLQNCMIREELGMQDCRSTGLARLESILPKDMRDQPYFFEDLICSLIARQAKPNAKKYCHYGVKKSEFDLLQHLKRTVVNPDPEMVALHFLHRVVELRRYSGEQPYKEFLRHHGADAILF